MRSLLAREMASSKLGWVTLHPTGSLLGRHALPVSCLSSVLSAVGQILNETWMRSRVYDVIFVALSLKGLHTATTMIERRTVTRFAFA
jgi:hypothetical protein